MLLEGCVGPAQRSGPGLQKVLTVVLQGHVDVAPEVSLCEMLVRGRFASSSCHPRAPQSEPSP